MDDIQQVRQIWESLGLPGIIDVHTHFMPKQVMDKVWQYFDSQGPLIGRHLADRLPHRRGAAGATPCAAWCALVHVVGYPTQAADGGVAQPVGLAQFA